MLPGRQLFFQSRGDTNNLHYHHHHHHHHLRVLSRSETHAASTGFCCSLPHWVHSQSVLCSYSEHLEMWVVCLILMGREFSKAEYLKGSGLLLCSNVWQSELFVPQQLRWEGCHHKSGPLWDGSSMIGSGHTNESCVSSVKSILEFPVHCPFSAPYRRILSTQALKKLILVALETSDCRTGCNLWQALQAFLCQEALSAADYWSKQMKLITFLSCLSLSLELFAFISEFSHR